MLGRLRARIREILGNRDASELIRGGGTNLLVYATGRVIGVAYVVAIARHYGAEGYGAFALSLTCLVIASVFGRCGLSVALLRLVAQYASTNRIGVVRDIFRKAVCLATASAVLIAGAFYWSSPVIAQELFGQVGLERDLRIMALALVPHVWVQLLAESLRGLKKILLYSLLIDVLPFAFGLFAFYGLKTWSTWDAIPAVSYLFGMAGTSVVGCIAWFRASGVLAVPSDTSVSAREILTLAIPLLFGTSMVLLMNWTDNIMLGVFRSEDEVGVYDVAFRIAILAGAILQAVNSIAAPKFAECFASGDYTGLRHIAVSSTRVMFWVTAPIVIVCGALPGLILSLFGEQFIVASTAFMILLIGTLINAASGSVGFILRMTGKERIFQNILFAATVINISLNAWLIPTHGINGAAVASVTSLAFWNLTSVYYVKRLYGFYTIYFPGLGRILRD